MTIDVEVAVDALISGSVECEQEVTRDDCFSSVDLLAVGAACTLDTLVTLPSVCSFNERDGVDDDADDGDETDVTDSLVVPFDACVTRAHPDVTVFALPAFASRKLLPATVSVDLTAAAVAAVVVSSGSPFCSG